MRSVLVALVALAIMAGVAWFFLHSTPAARVIDAPMQANPPMPEASGPDGGAR